MLPTQNKDAFIVATEYLLNDVLHATGPAIAKAISTATPTGLQTLCEIMSEDYPANKGLHRQLNDALFKLYTQGTVTQEAAINASNQPSTLSNRIFKHKTRN